MDGIAHDRPALSPVMAGTPTSPEEHRARIDRLTPLIHDLIAWQLVERTEAGAFVLHDDIQARLGALYDRQGPTSAEVYVGRTCERCNSSAVTWLVDGVRLCAGCRWAVEHAAVAGETQAGTDHGAHRRAHWWERRVS